MPDLFFFLDPFWDLLYSIDRTPLPPSKLLNTNVLFLKEKQIHKDKDKLYSLKF